MKITHVEGQGHIVIKKLLNDNSIAKVGWFETSKYPDGTPVAGIAAQNEFGNASKNIPPRPMLRSTADQNKSNWYSLILSGYQAVIAGNETPRSVMETVSLKAAGDVRKTISDLTEPALKKRTVAARLARKKNKTLGNLDKPLVDTGVLLGTVNNVVDQK